MSARPERRRWPYHTGQGVLIGAALGMIVGAALPWAVILGRTLHASPLAISWTLWAALMTLSAGIVPWRLVVFVSAALGGGTALGFAIWQTVHLLRLCPLSLDCLPGPGLGILGVAGCAALFRAARLVWPRG